MVKTQKLPNGVTVVCEERPNTKTVSMNVIIGTGSADEQAHENGLTSLAQEASFGGTKTRSRDQITSSIRAKGASYDSNVHRETTEYTAKSLARDTKDIFTILADVIRNPAFDETEVQKVKNQFQQYIEHSKQNPAHAALDKLYEAAYGQQAAGKSEMGTKQSIGSFTAAQARQKHQQLLSDPGNIVISFAGDIRFEDAVKLAKDHFADLSPGQALQKQATSFKGGDIRETNNNSQMNIIFGFEAPGSANDDKYKAILLQELLSGGMSSPLFQEIREKRGLVYSVGAAYRPLKDTGLFVIQAGTGQGKVGELMEVSMGLLGDIIKNGFTDKELETARTRIIRGLTGQMESAGLSAYRNGLQMLNTGKVPSLEEFKETLESITSDDLRRTCAAMLKSGKYVLSGIGPQDTMPTKAQMQTMMQKQLAGVTLPPAPPAPLKQQFTREAKPQKAQKTPAATIKSTTLANGLVVVTAEKPGTLSCGAWVGAGADHETPALNGATHMNEHMMFKGTPSYPPGTIDKIVEGELGGDLNAYTSKDKTAYYFYNLVPENLEKVIDICGEMVFEANLDAKEFGQVHTKADGTRDSSGERGVVLEEIRRANDNLNNRQWDLLYKTVYPNQPHGRPVLGTEDSLTAMSAAQLAAYRDEYYAPNNVVFVAAGPVKHEDFVDLIKKKYGHLQPTNFPPLPAPDYKGGTAYLESEAATVCSFSLVSKGCAGTDDDAYIYTALSEMLGGDESSLLQKELVYNQELVAGIAAGHLAYRNAGEFLVVANAEADKLKPVINEIYKQLRDLVNNPDQAALDKVKAAMEMQIVSAMESNRKACDSVGNYTLTHGTPPDTNKVLKTIRDISLDDIRRVGRKILASEPGLAMVVPQGTNPGLLPGHQDVVAMRDGKAKPPAPKTAGPKGPGPF